MSSCESFTPCKVIQDSLSFHVLSTGFHQRGTWIPDANRLWNSGFLELNSGFQSKGSQIVEKFVASGICLTLYGVN